MMLLLVALGFAPCHAEDFRNSYLRFALPGGWTCQQEEMVFVCDPPKVEGEAVPASIILTAKLASPNDTLAGYRRDLETRAAPLGPAALVAKPDVLDIDGSLWVDAILLGSELPNYYTRYLVTVKDDLVIIFTFSAHTSVYAQMTGVALHAVHSLQIQNGWRASAPRN
jgi:hypothetical protein